MIPKRAIDQAIATHLLDMARLREKLLTSLESDWKTLKSAYDSAFKALKDKEGAIEKEAKDKGKASYESYLRDMRSKEGGTFTTLEEERRTINAAASQQKERTQEDSDKSCEQAEERFKIRFVNVLAQYKADSIAAIDKFIAEHPGGGEGGE